MGRSISLCYPSHKIYSSGIVTGNIPIAIGVALDEKLKETGNHIWCFVGDMTAESGTFYENHKYAVNYDLPITFVIEDNGLAVETPKDVRWGSNRPIWPSCVMRYRYKLTWPHCNTGVWVEKYGTKAGNM